MKLFFNFQVFLLFVINLIESISLPSPFQIITWTERGKLEVVEEGLEELSKILNPISLIGVVGVYHSGKSFLLNSLLGEAKGFEVGKSVNATTKGLWLRQTDLKANDSSQVLFIDTEGFSDAGASIDHDSKIFAIATLLSSHLLYNSMGLLDQRSVDYLDLLTRTTQLFDLSNMNLQEANGKSIEIVERSHFPSLTWVLEDFSQNMAEFDCPSWMKQFLDTEYDQQQISFKSGIKALFTSKNCHTIFYPHNELSKLQNLGSIGKLSELNPQFIEDVRNLKELLLSDLTAKKIGGKSFNGVSLVSWIRMLVKAVNDEKFPKIPSIREAWYSKLDGDALSLSLSRFDNLLNNSLNIYPPINSTLLESLFESHSNEVMDLYKETLFNIKSLYQKSLSSLVKDVSQKFQNSLPLHSRRITEYVSEKSRSIIDSISLKFSEVKLPDCDGTISLQFKESQNNLKTKFYEILSNYSNEKSFINILQNGQKKIENENEKLIQKNNESIKDVLKKAGESFIKVYSIAQNDHFSFHHSAKFIKNLDEELKLKAIDEWNKVLSEVCPNFSTQLINIREYSTEMSFAKSKTDEIWRNTLIKNSANVNAFLEPHKSNLREEFLSNQSKIEPFPDEETTLQKKCTVLIADLLEKFKSYAGELADTKEFILQSKDLKQTLDAMVPSTVLDRNRRILSSLATHEKICVKDGLIEKQKNSGFLSFLTFSLSKTVSELADFCFEKYSKTRKEEEGFVISESQKKIIIQGWIVDHDFDMHDQSNLFLRVIVGLVSVLSTLYIFNKIRN